MADRQTDNSMPAAPRDGDAPAAGVGSYLRRLNALPEPVRDYMLSDEYADALDAVSRRHELSEDASDALAATASEVVFREVPLTGFADALAAAFADLGVSDPKAVARDALASALFPLQQYLGDVAGAVASLGGRVSEFEHPPQVSLDRTTYAEAVAEIVAVTGLDALPSAQRIRLEHLIESRFRNVRTDVDILDQFQRPSKVGGGGLSTEDALRVLQYVRSKAVSVQFADDDAAPAPTAGLSDEATGTAAPASAAPAIVAADDVETAPAAPAPEFTSGERAAAAAKSDLSLQHRTEDEARDLDLAAARVPETFEQSRVAPTSFDEAFKAAVAETNGPFADDDMKRRYETLVSLYFRDLRDDLETKSKFTMPVASGGMGLPDADAERLMDTLKKRVAEYRGAEAARAAAAKEAHVAARADAHLAGNDVRDAEEQVATDRAYGDLLVKAGLASTARAESAAAVAAAAGAAPAKVIPVSAPVAPRAQAVGVNGGAPAVPTAPKPPTPPTPPPAPPAPKPPTPSAPAAPKPPTPPVPAAPAAPKPPAPPAPVAPPPPALPSNLPWAAEDAPAAPATVPTPPAIAPAPPPMPPVPAVPPPAPPPRPAMAPVARAQAPTRLTGPVEELRQMRIEDFRRLAKDPREAIGKVKEKVDLLADLGYESRTAGVKAFIESDLNKMYLDLLRTSLEGTPVDELIAARTAKNEPVLAKPEFDALMELNRTLRFG